MADKFISSIHIQKLGHEIQEIRERALLNIISKLDHGFVYDNDLARSKEILSRLFEWFLFESCSKEDTVLNLIKRILQTETGSVLVKHYGAKVIKSELKQTQSYIDRKYHPLVKEILEYVELQMPIEVPPLVSDIPLSHRTGYSEQTLSNEVGTTATSIRGLIYHNESVEQGTGQSMGRSQETTAKDHDQNEEAINQLLPNFTLPWQPLIAPDRHVLESVEDSLRNPPQPSTLLHSCEFFIDVMLHDFPAEIFLQRPAIVLLLQNILSTFESTRLKTAALNCLLSLTKALQTRIHYYCDPCTINLKQLNIAHLSSGYSSPASENKCYVESYRSRLSSVSSHGDNNEDTAMLKTKQLCLPQFCFNTLICIFDYLHVKHESLSETKKRKSQMGLNVALLLVEKVTLLLNLCIGPELWDQRRFNTVVDVLHKFNDVLSRFGELLEFYRLEVISNDSDKILRAVHLHLLHNCVNILSCFVPLNKADMVLPRNFKNTLAGIVLDCSFAKLYPTAHATLVTYIQEFGGRYQTESLKKYNDVKDISSSISCAVKFIKCGKAFPIADSIKLAKQSLLSLEFHQNLSFLKTFIEICANVLPMHSITPATQDTLDEIVLSLLAHSNANIRETMYSLCHKRVAAAVGPKLNTTKAGAPGSQILFLLRPQIFIEMAAHGRTSDNKQISKYSEDILIHILKCKILVNDNIWNSVVEALIPSIPIMLCHAGKNDSLGRTLISLLDPDKAQSLYIADKEVLKGNACLLFADDNLARVEAVSRVCWLLASQNESRDMLPRLNNLHDKALASVGILKRTSDLNKMRGIQHFYQPSSLNQVLDLLNSDNVEPVIRRSAITQVSVMVEDPLLHLTFLERSGLKTVLKLMKSALTESEYRDYPDSIIPAICIMKNICLYNHTVRQELSNNAELLYYTLRGLFLYCTEGRMKQDGGTLLFLLLFSNFVHGSPSKGDMSLPHVVFDKLYVPFTCNVHWKTSKYSVVSLAATILSDKWCLTSIQIHWNSEWYGGFKRLLSWEKIDYGANEPDYNEILKLSENNLLALKSSSLECCITNSIHAIQNGTGHHNIIDSINKLTLYLNVYSLASSADTDHIHILSFKWEATFLRFINSPPASDDDTALLTSVLRFLAMLVPFYKNSDSPCWITGFLKVPSHCLFLLLQNDSTEAENKVLNQELLALITICACIEQHYLDFHTVANNNLKVQSSTSWPHIIVIIAENLQFNDAQHFYNLAYLDCLLSCLVHLTSTLGWSGCKPDSPPKAVLTQLISGLCELVGAFHCGKGPSAASSLMGLSITRHVILILNHLLVEMQNANVKGWETCFLGEDVGGQRTIPSLCALWKSRDIILRAAVIQLFSGLSISPRAATELFNEVKEDDNKGILEISLQVLLDHTEASIVRENVSILLANLLSHTMPTTNDNFTLVVNITASTIYKSKNAVEVIVNILDDCNFYKELEVILLCLYTENKFHSDSKHNFTMERTQVSDDSISLPKSTNKEEHHMYTYTKNVVSSGRSISTESSLISDRVTSHQMVATPGFIRALSIFTYNIMALAVENVIAGLQENGIIKMFFRCICDPSIEMTSTKDLALYCDILEMNTAICSLLSRAVSKSNICLGTVLHTKDCLHLMLSLLNPNLYHTFLPQLLYLRNKLWGEVFTLIGVLLETCTADESSRSCSPREAISVMSSALKECGHEPFLQTLCEAISSNCSTDLQNSALTSLTSLLRMETSRSIVNVNNTQEENSMQNLLDYTKTPRTCSQQGTNTRDNIENIEPRSAKSNDSLDYSGGQTMNVLEDVYFNNFNNVTCIPRKIKKNYINEPEEIASNATLMAGAELCKILLQLYEIVQLKSNSATHKRKGLIINTLTSVLCVSQEAKRYALENGLLEIVVKQLREVHIKLSLESTDCLRRVVDRKRLSPVLKELGSLIGLATNFMLSDSSVKCAASTLGLSDLMHKLWIWFLAQKCLLGDALKLLCTYTTDCAVACQSLTLTSPIAGAGPRKVASNISLLHAIFTLIGKEMEQVTRTHDLAILQLSFHLLQNTCAALECRMILSKSNLLQHLSRLHPAITKRQKPWESVELLWLTFLENLTGYPEGQSLVAKFPDTLELIVTFAASTKLVNRQTAMFVLRNIAFYQPNRSRLLTSDHFLQVLQTKLTNGSYEEVNIVVTIMWALAANNQKAKLVIKCARLDVKLQDTLKLLHLSNENVDQEDLQRMHFVLALLREGDKSR